MHPRRIRFPDELDFLKIQVSGLPARLAQSDGVDRLWQRVGLARRDLMRLASSGGGHQEARTRG